MHDAMKAARGRPRNSLIPDSDDLVRVVEFIEVHLHRTRQGAVRPTRAGRVDMDAEILAGRLTEKDQPVTRECAGEFDGIAVRPVG